MARGLCEALGIPYNEPDPPSTLGTDEDFLNSTGKEFSQKIVNSREYRQSLLRRLMADTLAPAVECRLLDHALGKPLERVEVEDKTIRLDQYTVEQLEERAMLLATLARRIRTNDGVPRPEPESGPPSAVH